MWLLLFHLSIIFQYCFCENLVTDVTRQVLNIPDNVNGFATAYTDINNDKLTDICLVSGDRKMVSLLLGGSETGTPLTLYKSLHVRESNLYIVGTVPGDFNGDGNVDILVSMLDTSSLKQLVQIKLFWGNEENTFTNQQNIDGLIQDEPLMLDANADMISDLLVTLPNGTRQFWLGHLGPVTENWSFKTVSFSTSLPKYPVKSPHSNSFVDLSGDGAADLFITSVDSNNEAVFEIWKGTELELKLISNYSFSSLLLNHNNIEVGQSVFADINGDGLLEHILPVCELQGKRCIHSMIVVYLDGDWIELFSGGDDLNFISSQTSFLNVPITLVLGDFNQDIHMDLVCVMQTTNDSKSQAHILYGGPCSDAKCQKANHQFSHKLAIPNSDGAFSASFYSLQNNGALDILVSTSATNVSLHAYHNIGVNDASFVTIKVLPGSEEIRSCNVAGPTVQYNSINVMGGNQRFSAVQLSQSAHLSLQLPYVSFGLGRLPNFIDSITVFVPLPLIPSSAGSQNKYEVLHSTWTMLIPNSKLYVIPYPVNDTSMWRNILVVTPSRNIVSTAIVLLSTCFIVAITTTILHCLERREDKREKIREAHRFHFDAM